jgi:hypothetical protein
VVVDAAGRSFFMWLYMAAKRLGVNPFADDDLAGKLEENREPLAGANRTEKLMHCLASIETLRSVRETTALLALSTSDVDRVTAE